MEQIKNYDLLQAIDPTKVKVPISERFAKLTLSSNKKQQQKCGEEPDQEKEYRIQKEKRDSVARNITKQFEEEYQIPGALNPLLRSESSKEFDEHENSVDEQQSGAEHLTMEPLEVSEDGVDNNAEQVQNNLELLSQQMASLVMGTKPISLSSGSTGDLSVFTDLLTSESQPSSISEADKIHIIHHIPIDVKEAVKRETIALNLTSNSTDNFEETPELHQDEVTDAVKHQQHEEDDEDDEDEDEAITISDTSDSYHEPDSENIMLTSSLPSTSLKSEDLKLPSLVADKAERVAAFLRDVSLQHRVRNEQGQLVVHDTIDRILDNKEIDQIQANIAKAKQIATADTESMTPDVGEEITPKSLIEREQRLKTLEDFEKNKESGQKGKQPGKKYVETRDNNETLDKTLDLEFHKDCSPKTPKAGSANIYRLANDETQCNTEFTLHEETPKLLTPKDKRALENSRRRASLEAEDFTEKRLPNQNKAKLDAYRLANEDTMTNSVLSNIDDGLAQQSFEHDNSRNYKTRNYSQLSTHSTPTSGTSAKFKETSDISIVNSSNEDVGDSVPEVSITISETDSDKSSADEEKSQSMQENSDDKKLSNSFHREESSDDSEYEQKISKIQMSMANINISAKINIKIHIPQNISVSSEDDDQNDQQPPDKTDIVSQSSKPLTDRSESKSAEEKNDNNNVSYEQSDASESPEIRKNEQHSNNNRQNNRNSNNYNCCLNEKSKNLKKDKSYNKNQSYKYNNQSILSATSAQPCKQIQTKKPKDSIASIANKSLDSSTEIQVEDEKFLSEAEKLLTQLYGTAWQTPDVIRTLKRTSQSAEKKKSNNKKSSAKQKQAAKVCQEAKSDKRSLAEESVLHDFSIFRRNIAITNLDSTRLETPKSREQQNIEPFTEPKNSRKPLMQETDLHAQPQTERKSKTAAVAKTITRKRRPAAANNQKWRQLIDSNSNSEADNASDDEDADQSWSKNASELEVSSSDSDFEISPKARNRKNKSATTTKHQGRSDKSDYLTKILNRSKDGEIVYLDLTKEEVEVQEDVPASPPANHDLTFASRLQDILKTCRHEDKAKLPSSNKKTKRKLFTPHFGDDEFECAKPKDDEAKLKEIDQENVNDSDILQDIGKCPFDILGRQKVFDVVNKQLESVKTGRPIFQLTPSPKKKTSKLDTVTPGGKSATKANKNDETNFKTPSTLKPKAQQTPRALKDLGPTLAYKYSFLKSLDVTVSKALCHPEAVYYRDNYRTKKEELSKILYDLYNEKLFNNKLEVPLIWNKKLLNTAGRCLNKKKLGIRSSVVELSEKVLTGADRLRCTLIHELCHAATWIFNGEGGHGSTWKEWARKANTIFPEIPKIGVCHQYDIEYKYTYKCTLCAAKSHAHSKSKKVENIRCSYCHGAIEVFLNKKDKYGNVIPTPVKEATGFAKFVKDNYKKFKRDDLKHADIMKLLSNEFAALKVTST